MVPISGKWYAFFKRLLDTLEKGCYFWIDMNFLYIASGTLTIFFTLLLLSKPSKSIADKILIIWFFLMLPIIATIYVVHYQIPGWNAVVDFAEASSILFGPLTLGYTLALTQADFKLRLKDLIHAIPFVISLMIIFYFLFSGQRDSTAANQFRLVNMYFKLTILLVYSILSLIVLQKHTQRVFNIFSNIENKELNWLKFLILGVLSIWAISMISQTLVFTTDIKISQYGGFYTNTALNIFIIIWGYFGFRQTTIFMPIHLVESVEKPISDKAYAANKAKSRAEKNDLTKKHFVRLRQFMEKEKPYLDSNLTLYNLAASLKLSPTLLSQAINQHAKQNFFDFVNQYRVEQVKQQLQAGADYQHTLLGIALDAGFNSKTSFNRAFKKFTGMTPSEYKLRYIAQKE